VAEEANLQASEAASRKAKLEQYRQEKATRKAAERKAQRQPFKVGVYKLNGKFPDPSSEQQTAALGKTRSIVTKAGTKKQDRKAKVTSTPSASSLNSLAQRNRSHLKGEHEANSKIFFAG